MALNREDKHDISHSLGRALASKVSKVTRDKFDIPRKASNKDVLAKSNRQKAGIDFKFKDNS